MTTAYTCVTCQKEFWQDGRGRKRKYCPEHVPYRYNKDKGESVIFEAVQHEDELFKEVKE